MTSQAQLDFGTPLKEQVNEQRLASDFARAARGERQPMSRLEHRPTQCARLLALLEARANQWVPLPEILALGIAQYNARLYELRHTGHRIENRVDRIEYADGRIVKKSWFRLVSQAGQRGLFGDHNGTHTSAHGRGAAVSKLPYMQWAKRNA